MKRFSILVWIGLFLSCSLWIGCGASGPTDAEKEKAAAEKAAAELLKVEKGRAEALKAAVKGYETWGQHPKFKGIQKSTDGTHGAYVQVWMNDKAAAVMGKFSGTFPDGSIFVKRGYDDKEGKKPKDFITLMQKIKDYDKPNGGWFTLRIWDNDKNPLSGWAPDKKSGCIGCHSSAKEKYDYIRYLRDLKITF